MATTTRQYYQIFRTPSFATSIGRSAGDISAYNIDASTLAGDKILIAAPGVGKKIVLLSISSSSQDFSLGTGSAGASTVMYVADGGVSFPSGFAIAENAQVSCNASSGFLSITYIIVNV